MQDFRQELFLSGQYLGHIIGLVCNCPVGEFLLVLGGAAKKNTVAPENVRDHEHGPVQSVGSF